MGKVKRVMRCYLCGSVLQSKKKNEKGYIEPEYLKDPYASEQVLYCHSCHEKMKAINTGILARDVDDDILKVLDDAVASDAFILWTIDSFTFNGTFDKDLVKKIKHLKITVVATKFDLFPKSVKEKDFKQYVIDRFNDVGINPISVVLISDLNKFDIHDAFVRLHRARAGHDVYLIGSSQSGKTSLINAMLKAYTNKSKRVIRTEEYPGTNINVLEIPLSNSSFFYELPGFSLVNSVRGKVEKDIARMISPVKEIKSASKTLLVGATLFIGSLGYFMLEKGKPTPVKIYSGEKTEVKMVSNKKSNEFFENNIEKRSLRPVSERYTSFTDFDLFEYVMENDGKRHDISITGLCWISFIAKGQVIRVALPRGTALKESLSKIK